MKKRGSLLLPLSHEYFPPSISHDESDAGHVPHWTEAADGDVALLRSGRFVSLSH